ncbi:SigE family RNA polymerase sigma factor [Dactylosporangium sp. AC04546]|uniref:SigE family RNA polymerase sigma factor n=1 Tax=Dactylosporangium sp. AC04546 TaxID=2862460 RepID=UPI001EE06451|nr:SigE family RNA polymerase sigma factor [Dactylosporangium sp. AC04546]WVK86783.1 SigE family RNA polymerase sigma factor [Dactylosporangium sp. AC04546]
MEAEESFHAYVSGRLAALSRMAYLLCGDRHTAEDLVQATLIRVARHWERVSAGGDPDPYVRRAMVSQHVSLWRRRWRLVQLTERPPERPVPDAADTVATALAVQAALATLTPRQRAVLVLRYFEDLTETATAEVMRCSVSTVKSQTRDALAALRVRAPELADLAQSTEVPS